MFMGKSETASLSGLELRLHTKWDPKAEIPVFHPSDNLASSSVLVGTVGTTDSKLSYPSLMGDVLIARGGLGLTSPWVPLEGPIVRSQFISSKKIQR